MAHESKAQEATIHRVMHEFKEGELESSSGKKVTDRKQAVAIGLREAGASKNASAKENKKNLAHTKQKERQAKSRKSRKG